MKPAFLSAIAISMTALSNFPACGEPPNTQSECWKIEMESCNGTTECRARTDRYKECVAEERARNTPDPNMTRPDGSGTLR